VTPAGLTRISALARRAGVSYRTMLRRLRRLHEEHPPHPDEDWLVEIGGPSGRVGRNRVLYVNEELLRRAAPGFFAPPRRVDASTLESVIEDLAHRVRKLERVTEYHSRSLGGPRG
jgi:hypothetical protein